MTLEDIAQLTGSVEGEKLEALKNAVISLVGAEKQRGIEAANKKGQETEKFRNALKDVGYDPSKYESIKAFLDDYKTNAATTQTKLSESEKVQQALREYGVNLGLAFQIRDDYLDMSSDPETLGKDIGNDIRNGKKTIIAVHSLTHATGKDKKILSDIFGKAKASAEEVKKVYRVFNRVGSIDYAKEKAEEYSTIAKDALKVLKDSTAKQVLVALADYAMTREK